MASHNAIFSLRHAAESSGESSSSGALIAGLGPMSNVLFSSVDKVRYKQTDETATSIHRHPEPFAVFRTMPADFNTTRP